MLFSQASALGSLPNKHPRACPQVPAHASDAPVKSCHIAKSQVISIVMCPTMAAGTEHFYRKTSINPPTLSPFFFLDSDYLTRIAGGKI